MGLRDRLHNGQPETGATPGTSRWRKALEGMGKVAVGEAGAVIPNLYLDSVTAAPTHQLNIPGAMGQRIVHEVAQRILQPLPVGRDHTLVGLNHDRSCFQLGSTAAALGHVSEQITNVQRFPVEAQPVFVGRREHQQLFGQPAEPVGLLTDRRHGCAKIIAFGCLGLSELDLGLDDRQRGTQLVAGISQKPPLLLQRVPLRRLGPSDSVEHVVQGAPEPSDLVSNR